MPRAKRAARQPQRQASAVPSGLRARAARATGLCRLNNVLVGLQPTVIASRASPRPGGPRSSSKAHRRFKESWTRVARQQCSTLDPGRAALGAADVDGPVDERVGLQPTGQVRSPHSHKLSTPLVNRAFNAKRSFVCTPRAPSHDLL